jgi:hypothetical protein
LRFLAQKELLSDKQWKRALLDLEISRKVKTMAKRVAYYLNQFFGGIGGEEAADIPLQLQEAFL